MKRRPDFAPPPDLAYTAIRPMLEALTECRRCPRLVAWREAVAEAKVKRHADELYWGRPVPSFGDPEARLLIIGLAPAAHGANRTARMFTGDRSGDWLYRALHKAGFANQSTSQCLSDGLLLKDAYITASVRCAPPDNKPLPEEFANCRPYLTTELALMQNIRVIVALGKIGWDTILREARFALPKGVSKPKFGHGSVAELPGDITLIGSYHPSQQNTFTGKLTEPMFDAIFDTARKLLDDNSPWPSP
ncbi:MAG TPA: uracil-DNA glycosylase [Coleofasciculaceae cyanobacterium]|jgi:uracil-DNA glycosylase family 4